MYAPRENLGSLKSFFKKTKHAIEKIHPRELSPTRMIKKYTADQKKKAKEKELTRVTSAPKAPPGAIPASFALPEAPSPFANMNSGGAAPWQPAATPPEPASDSTPYLLAGAAALAALVILSRKKKK